MVAWYLFDLWIIKMPNKLRGSIWVCVRKKWMGVCLYASITCINDIFVWFLLSCQLQFSLISSFWVPTMFYIDVVDQDVWEAIWPWSSIHIEVRQPSASYHCQGANCMILALPPQGTLLDIKGWVGGKGGGGNSNGDLCALIHLPLVPHMCIS